MTLPFDLDITAVVTISLDVNLPLMTKSPSAPQVQPSQLLHSGTPPALKEYLPVLSIYRCYVPNDSRFTFSDSLAKKTSTMIVQSTSSIPTKPVQKSKVWFFLRNWKQGRFYFYAICKNKNKNVVSLFVKHTSHYKNWRQDLITTGWTAANQWVVPSRRTSWQ